jgi:RNA polymerase sigma-70 factor (ECF subfamily)
MRGNEYIERLYREHGHLVLRRARQVLGDEHEARDVLQELFISLLRRPEQFQGRSQAITFLYSATTHLCLNRLRNGRTRLKLVEEVMAPRSSEVAFPRGERLAEARGLLSRLPEELREAAIYYYFDEMTHEEIAEVMGCSRRHVGNLLERVRERVLRLGDGPGKEKV